VVEPGDEADRVKIERVAYEEERDRKAEDDPCEMLFQNSLKPSGRIPS